MAQMYTKRSTPIQQALQRFFDKNNGNSDLRLAKLWDAWDTLFDPGIAELIRPLGHTKDVLVLGAEDAIVMQEFTYFSDQILERVNTFLGTPFFARVRIELLKGRSPLNTRLLAPVPPKKALARPGNLGNLTHSMDDTSPVARAYKKYVRLFATDTPDDSDNEAT